MNNKKRKENDFIIVVKDIKTHCVIENKDIIVRHHPHPHHRHHLTAYNKNECIKPKALSLWSLKRRRNPRTPNSRF